MKRLALALVSIAFPVSAALAQGGGHGSPGTGGAVPLLSISSPEIGSVITVKVEGALPGAPVALAYSPHAGQLVLPQGTVWLDVPTLRFIGSGTVGPQGSLAFHFAIPMQASLAEAEVHLQALVLDPGAAGGAAFTNSLDLRLLGSRLYMSVTLYPDVYRLLAKSAVHDQDVFYAEFLPAGRPVFNANRSLGAVISLDAGLVIFDNFFGGVVHAVPVGISNYDLIADAAHTGFFKRSPDRIERFDFASGLVTGTLPVPPGATAWVGNDSGTEAYLAYVVASQPEVRRIDLVQLSDLGATPVGASGETFQRIDHAGGRVLALTATGVWPSVQATLSRVDYASGTPVVVATPAGGTGQWAMLAVPAADVVLTWTGDWCNPFSGGYFTFEMLRSPLSTGGATTPVQKPPLPFGSFCAKLFAGVSQGTNAWFADGCCSEYPDFDDVGALWRLDPVSLAWDVFEVGNLVHVGSTALTVVEDAFASRVFTAHQGLVPPMPGAELHAIDTASLAQETIPYSQHVYYVDSDTFHGESIP